MRSESTFLPDKPFLGWVLVAIVRQFEVDKRKVIGASGISSSLYCQEHHAVVKNQLKMIISCSKNTCQLTGMCTAKRYARAKIG
jgi:hypothetical protein